MKVRKSIYISAEDYEYLQQCAELNSRSVNQFISMILREWIDRDILIGKEGERDDEKEKGSN